MEGLRGPQGLESAVMNSPHMSGKRTRSSVPLAELLRPVPLCDCSDECVLVARADSVEKWCVSTLSGLWADMCVFVFVKPRVSCVL